MTSNLMKRRSGIHLVFVHGWTINCSDDNNFHNMNAKNVIRIVEFAVIFLFLPCAFHSSTNFHHFSVRAKTTQKNQILCRIQHHICNKTLIQYVYSMKFLEFQKLSMFRRFRQEFLEHTVDGRPVQWTTRIQLIAVASFCVFAIGQRLLDGRTVQHILDQWIAVNMRHETSRYQYYYTTITHSKRINQRQIKTEPTHFFSYDVRK